MSNTVLCEGRRFRTDKYYRQKGTYGHFLKVKTVDEGMVVCEALDRLTGETGDIRLPPENIGRTVSWEVVEKDIAFHVTRLQQF